MQDATRVYQLFCIFYAASRDRFLMSHILNRLAVETVIMLETKGFSLAIKDKIIVRENNQIAKHLYLIFTLSRVRPFLLVSFSHLTCFSHLADVSRTVCSQLK